MVTVDPVQAVQKGLWSLLRADPAIMQTVRDVLDEVPELNARQYPFIAIPDPSSIPDGTHDDPGRRVTARIHTFVQGDVRARNTRPENTIGARITALLDHQHAALNTHVADHTVWMVHHTEARKINDQDRSVRHRVDIVDIWVSNT